MEIRKSGKRLFQQQEKHETQGERRIMADFEIITKDNTDAIIKALERQCLAALEELGLRAEGYAKMKAPVGTPESTGVVNYVSSGLKKSITHKVVNREVYIGTNNKAPNGAPYPAYVEFGTGIYATDGKGRKSPWTWYDKNGKAHWTHGIKPVHYLRDAVSDHKDEYKKVLLKYLKGNG
jgi:hypothetical protein